MNVFRANGLHPIAAERVCEACRLSDCALRDMPDHATQSRLHRLKRGDRLESMTGHCLQFWIIMSGWAATCTVFSDGRRQILGIETAGDVICAAMASEQSENWLEALDDVEICEVDLSDQGAILRHESAFLSAVFGITHRRLARSEAHLSTLGRLDSRERVLLFLAEMALRAPGPVVHLSMSREDIADYLGLNSETVSRILTHIRKSGLVNFLNATEYVVPDMAQVADRLPVALPGPMTAGAMAARHSEKETRR